MPDHERRRFIGLLTGAIAALRGETLLRAQAPPQLSMRDAGDRRRQLGAALRALNDAAGLGVTPDELERAEAYATGALLEAEARLRPIVLDESIDLSVTFQARRRS